MVQNDKRIYPLCSISQGLYIIWLSFMVHMCKMIIYRGVGFCFSKFWFSGLSGKGGEGQKNGPKWQEILSVVPYISRTIHQMIFIYGANV